MITRMKKIRQPQVNLSKHGDGKRFECVGAVGACETTAGECDEVVGARGRDATELWKTFGYVMRKL